MKKEKTTSIAEKILFKTNAIFPPFCDLRIRKADAYQRLLTSKYFLRNMRKQNAHLLLSLNIAKTEFMVISTRQKFLAENCSEINIQLDGHPIYRVEHATSLGLIIDDRLSWSNHIKELCRKISSAIGALRRIRSLISQSTAEQIYNALIQPYFDYCAPVWDELSSYLCEKLQKLQNRAARVILQANCEVNSSLLLETLKWGKLSLRRRKH